MQIWQNKLICTIYFQLQKVIVISKVQILVQNFRFLYHIFEPTAISKKIQSQLKEYFERGKFESKKHKIP